MKLKRSEVYLAYVLTANLFVTTGFLALFRFPQASSRYAEMIGKASVFQNQFIEGVIIALLGSLLAGARAPLRILSYASFALYFMVNTLQLASYYIGGEYLTRLALENRNHIVHLLDGRTLTGTALLLTVVVSLPILVERAKSGAILSQSRRSLVVSLVLIPGLALSLLSSPEIAAYKTVSLEISNVENKSPFFAFFQLLTHSKQAALPDALTAAELSTARDLGIHINQGSKFPLAKGQIYNAKSPLPLAAKQVSRPNVIVFFVEGLSARLVSSYSGTFKSLTPHIASFAAHSDTMVVDNYYNHTAATYRGLHGQLCSLWPLSGGIDWMARASQLSMLNYYCLPHYLANIGYKTNFLYSQKRDDTFLDELASQIGFKHIAPAEVLSRDFLASAPLARSEALSDQQLLTALSAFLDTEQKQTSPFFVALYNFETHAFLSLASDGVPYGDGQNPVLNSTHNFDDAFGKFWKKFLDSPLSKNTVVVLTADHAHYHEKPYVDAISEFDPNYQRLFFDRIPLVIYDPTHTKPERYDADFRSSIDFSPSLIHLLELPNTSNPFVGTSIFEPDARKPGGPALAAIGDDFYWADSAGIFTYLDHSVPSEKISAYKNILGYLRRLEEKNRVWPEVLKSHF